MKSIPYHFDLHRKLNNMWLYQRAHRVTNVSLVHKLPYTYQKEEKNYFIAIIITKSSVKLNYSLIN